MKKPVAGKNQEGEVYTQERCFILELSNTPEDPDVSVARARVAPGVTTRWHQLRGVTERYCILSGKGRVEVGNRAPWLVQTGDVVHIEPMCRQRISNIGEEDLIFLAVCTPRFTPDLYIDRDDSANG
jgi:mannose-6-phosphate isomerase-like protein (cupin superfamily)